MNAHGDAIFMASIVTWPLDWATRLIDWFTCGHVSGFAIVHSGGDGPPGTIGTDAYEYVVEPYYCNIVISSIESS